MTSRLSLYVFSALLVVCAILAVTSSASLPDSVAVHFNAKSEADAWVSRDRYRVLIFFFIVGLPLFLVWVMAWLPRLTGGKGQIPDHEYWFASERRLATEQFLFAHACWLGTITVAMIYGIHIALQRANAVTPAALGTDQLSTMLLIFICGLGWWITSFLRHFRRR
jgi:uncharacterized membrane protein